MTSPLTSEERAKLKKSAGFNLTQPMIDTWWWMGVVLFIVGAALIHYGLAIMLVGALLGVGSARADMQKEMDDGD